MARPAVTGNRNRNVLRTNNRARPTRVWEQA